MTLVEDLVWLIETPSVTGEEAVIAAAIAERLDQRHPVRRVGNSVVVGDLSRRPLTTLYGHLDTVPAQGNLTARVDGERVHGLGASDMKSGLAVMLGLMESEAVAGADRGVVAVFYDKEEGPSHENGLEDVLNEVPELTEAEVAIVLEPTDLELQLGCQGALNATVSFIGRSAHSARPWLGENAVTKGGAWLAELHERRWDVVEVEGLEFRELFSVTMASGGIARNMIPPRFDINLNMRFPPSRTLDEAEAVLRDVAASADSIEIVDRAQPAPPHRDHPAIQALAVATGAPLTAKQAWTDVARLAARGVPALNFGPGEVAQAHQATESAPIAPMQQAFSALERYLTR